MAFSTNDIYIFIRFLIRKVQAGGLSRSDLMYAWNAEQKAYMDDLLGRFQVQQPDMRMGNNTGLIQNEAILTKLGPFTRNVDITLVGSYMAPKPSDYRYGLATRVGAYKVTSIRHDQIATVNDDIIDTPSNSAHSYYQVEYLNFFSIIPSLIGAISLDYIAVPQDIVWAYTVDAYGRQIYNASASVQPQWNDHDIIEISKRCLKSLGVSFKDSDFTGFGSSVIATGD